jgi:Family of unknown function (DUF6328)
MNDQDPSGRDETPQERADRKWGDLLQELRVMQTGVQLLAGFLLTLPFQQKFSSLEDYQRDFYLVLVVLAGVTTALVMTPVAAHRTLSGRQVKSRLVDVGARVASIALGGVAVLVVGITTFVFDVVVDATWAIVVGALMALVLLTLLVVLPRRLITHDL